MARGERAALGELFQLFSPRLLAVGVVMLGSREDAEEILHEVFLEAWRHAASYDATRGTVATWLAVRMRSRCLDRRRSNPARRHVPWDERFAESPSAAVDQAPSRTVEHQRMKTALLSLPEEQREVLLLGYFDGLSSVEMAERTGVAVGTIKSRVRRGLLRLRELLEDES